MKKIRDKCLDVIKEPSQSLTSNNVSNSGKFQPLTPTDAVDLKGYREPLDYIFQNDSIRNVAITGPYSSGKSSLIETYKKEKVGEIRFLNITLAHFEYTTSSKTQNVKTTGKHTNQFEELKGKITDSNYSEMEKISQSDLEGKILNQLIHQIDHKNIPQTNFMVKKEITRKKIYLIAAILSILFLFLMHFTFYDSWKQYVDTLSNEWLQQHLFWSINNTLLLISGIGIVIISILAIYKLVVLFMFRRISFKKFNLQGNNIEILQESEDSFFDKNLNEVLYLFEGSKADVIIFEDLDRFDFNEVFVRLREVNTLVNLRLEKLGKRKPLRFFYLLRDDVFNSKDRTKFFDFIIPVVPIIDASNSFDKFIEIFESGGILDHFEEHFLQELSLYVDDMRILLNIQNEYQIYYMKIQETELDHHRLLSIIVYKNLFPGDFSDLQLGRGFVHSLFSRKKDLILKRIIEIDNEIEEIEKRIQLMEKEYLQSVHELYAIYLAPGSEIINIRGLENNRAELIKIAIGNKDVINFRESRFTSTAERELENIKGNKEFIERKMILEEKINNGIEEQTSKIQLLKNEKVDLRELRLKNLINKHNIDEIFNGSVENHPDIVTFNLEIRNSPYFDLIKFLLRNGHIDETYPDYMTFFHGNSLSHSDKIFLRSVTDQKKKAYTYEIKSPHKVLSRLRVLDFDNEEILNFDLLDYLLGNVESNEIYLKRFLTQLKTSKNFDFIGSYIYEQRTVSQFVKHINKLWPEICDEIINKSRLSPFLEKEYMTLTLMYSSTEDIMKLNINGCLTQYISNTTDLLLTYYSNSDKLMKDLIQLKVRFREIKRKGAIKELLELVYINSLYEINYKNIQLMLKEYYGEFTDEDFLYKNYTLIMSKPNQPLAIYINENINEYIESVFDLRVIRINDDEEVVLRLLNNIELDEAKKKEYISYLKTPINQIEEVQSRELWVMLLEYDLILGSEHNVLQYYLNTGKKLDKHLINFINKHYKNITLNKLFNIEKDDDPMSKLFDSIVQCNDLSNDSYRKITGELGFIYSEFSFKEISEEKTQLLILSKVIEMNSMNLLFMRENYSSSVLLLFIKKNVEDYIRVVNDNPEVFIYEEMIDILDLNGIQDSDKIALLKITNKTVPIKDRGYSNTLKAYILNHHFYEEDFPSLLTGYGLEKKVIQDIIKEKAIKSLSEIINNKYKLDIGLLSELLKIDNLEKDQKIWLLANSIKHIDSYNCFMFFKVLGLRNFCDLFERKSPTFDVNDVNREILEELKKRDWITEFNREMKDGREVYRANGKSVDLSKIN